jgi:hypothetical protein
VVGSAGFGNLHHGFFRDQKTQGRVQSLRVAISFFFAHFAHAVRKSVKGQLRRFNMSEIFSYFGFDILRHFSIEPARA